MSSQLVNSVTNKIEKWKLVAQQKYNGRLNFKLNDKETINFLSPDIWGICILSNNYQTSCIDTIDLANLSIITMSGSKYNLGEPIENKYLELLQDFFSKK